MLETVTTRLVSLREHGPSVACRQSRSQVHDRLSFSHKGHKSNQGENQSNVAAS
jgi:hypothetical protein